MVTLFTQATSSRLQYITSFISKETGTGDWAITTSAEAFRNAGGIRINYSTESFDAPVFTIRPHGLLSETGIRDVNPSCFIANGIKCFFKTGGDLPFDLFAASFYLLSRYEEYLPHEKDLYGRYAFTNSLAYREKFLDIPLVNKWMAFFCQLLSGRFPAFAIKPVASFTFLPTYDIDMGWSYRHKGFSRNAGGFLRSLLKGRFGEIKERYRVLTKKQIDPFDAFSWMNQLHERHRLKPYYFFLLPVKRGRYDKNISPGHPAMQALVRDHVIRYPVGIHPSWQSGDDPAQLTKEIAALEHLQGSKVLSSRQHYIRFMLPEGYRRLLQNGIRFDFSMGYGSINGFRASVASPFYWYDLLREESTDLLLFPFCFMEANSFYEQKQNATEALEEMRHYYRVTREVNGLLCMIWHNTFLGTDPLYKGWRDAYETFINEMEIPRA